VAGHRNTHGKPLNQVGTLQIGDAIVVEVPEGWYTYRFRTLEYVKPSGVGVLNPVPQADGVEATDSFITLTSCNPAFSTAERIIAYGVFESWTPRAAGTPAVLTQSLEG
jgi:sortase A